jgi:hypothetical protein
MTKVSHRSLPPGYTSYLFRFKRLVIAVTRFWSITLSQCFSVHRAASLADTLLKFGVYRSFIIIGPFAIRRPKAAKLPSEGGDK